MCPHCFSNIHLCICGMHLCNYACKQILVGIDFRVEVIGGERKTKFFENKKEEVVMRDWLTWKRF